MFKTSCHVYNENDCFNDRSKNITFFNLKAVTQITLINFHFIIGHFFVELLSSLMLSTVSLNINALKVIRMSDIV